jgi:hypothetical protein
MRNRHLAAAMIVLSTLAGASCEKETPAEELNFDAADASWFEDPESHAEIRVIASALEAELSDEEVQYLYWLDWSSFASADDMWRDPAVQKMIRATASAVENKAQASAGTWSWTSVARAQDMECTKARKAGLATLVEGLIGVGVGVAAGYVATKCPGTLKTWCLGVAGMLVLDGVATIQGKTVADIVGVAAACASEDPDVKAHCERKGKVYLAASGGCGACIDDRKACGYGCCPVGQRCGDAASGQCLECMTAADCAHLHRDPECVGTVTRWYSEPQCANNLCQPPTLVHSCTADSGNGDVCCDFDRYP